VPGTSSAWAIGTGSPLASTCSLGDSVLMATPATFSGCRRAKSE
jgi:hypothetical protein